MISNRRNLAASLLFGIFIFSGVPVLAQSSPNYAAQSHVLSGGGPKTVSPNYTLQATLGQSAGIGISSSDNYFHYAGFWYTLNLRQMLFLPLMMR